MRDGNPLDAYLGDIARRLRSLPPDAREMEMREVKAHLEALQKRFEAEGVDDPESRALREFGPAASVAAGIRSVWKRGQRGTFRQGFLLALGLAALAGQFQLRGLGLALFVPSSRVYTVLLPAIIVTMVLLFFAAGVLFGKRYQSGSALRGAFYGFLVEQALSNGWQLRNVVDYRHSASAISAGLAVAGAMAAEFGISLAAGWCGVQAGGRLRTSGPRLRPANSHLSTFCGVFLGIALCVCVIGNITLYVPASLWRLWPYLGYVTLALTYGMAGLLVARRQPERRVTFQAGAAALALISLMNLPSLVVCLARTHNLVPLASNVVDTDGYFRAQLIILAVGSGAATLMAAATGETLRWKNLRGRRA